MDVKTQTNQSKYLTHVKQMRLRPGPHIVFEMKVSSQTGLWKAPGVDSVSLRLDVGQYSIRRKVIDCWVHISNSNCSVSVSSNVSLSTVCFISEWEHITKVIARNKDKSTWKCFIMKSRKADVRCQAITGHKIGCRAAILSL